MRLSTFVIAVCFGGALALPPPASHVLHEKRDRLHAKWQKRDRLDKDAILPVRIGLKQRNLHRAEELLMDVSHPESPNYAKHYTSEEVIELFAPSHDTVSIVTNWLTTAGIAKERITHTDNKAWLAFDATTHEAESLLHAEFHEYEFEGSGKGTIACDSYHLPKDVQEHVDFVTPGIKLMKSRKISKRGFGMSGHAPKPPIKKLPVTEEQLSTIGDELKNCDVLITPICISTLYQFPPGTLANRDNAMGIFEEGDFYAQEDLDLFFRNFTPQIPRGTHPAPAFIDGAEAPVPVEDAGGESDLDFQLAYPILWPQGIVLYQTDDFPNAVFEIETDGGFNTFLDALDGSYCTSTAFGETGDAPGLDPVYPDLSGLPGAYTGQLQCGVYKPTNVISVSYGGQEADLPAFYQQRQCNEFLKLGLQGHSIFYASGDDGVAGPPGDDSDNGCLGNGTIFSPAWPNSCPFITNVGATKIYPGHTAFEVESAVVDPVGMPFSVAFSSGGGFSNIYPIPSYQAKAVATYFAEHNPPYKFYEGGENIGKDGGVYNRLGRGYPDVAANGDNIALFVEGNFTFEGGTSASTPIFASIVNRINEERLAIGKSPVGFINPVLYANPGVLNDITNGTNPGCGTVGFNTSKGWDPVSGLGTANFPRMLALFLSLP